MDKTKIKELYEQYGFLIMGRCTKILKNREDAFDATQEVFIKLIKHIDTLPNQEMILPWLYVTAKNHCLNIIRKNSRLEIRDNFDHVTYEDDKNEETLNVSEVINLIDNERVAEAVYFTYIDKLTQVEIQKVTGQSPATIRRNLQKFKAMVPSLKKRLQQV